MKLSKDITVIDDFLDKEYQEKIKNVLMGNDHFLWQNEEINFDWYFISDVTDAYSSRQQKRSALVHTFFEEGETISDDTLNYLFLPMLKSVRERMKIKNMNVVQGRSFLQFPLSLKDKTPDTPHIDLDQGVEHIVALYYVCDGDGDTIIYNEREDQGLESKSYTIKEKVTPKQGRMVIFDGTLYHTAEQPKDNIRCVVNYDLEII